MALLEEEGQGSLDRTGLATPLVNPCTTPRVDTGRIF